VVEVAANPCLLNRSMQHYLISTGNGPRYRSKQNRDRKNSWPLLQRRRSNLAKETAKKRNALAFAMRGPWGPKLRDIPGRVLYGTAERPLDEDGNPA
jgi:hypothetical protein